MITSQRRDDDQDVSNCNYRYFSFLQVAMDYLEFYDMEEDSVIALTQWAVQEALFFDNYENAAIKCWQKAIWTIEMD